MERTAQASHRTRKSALLSPSGQLVVDKWQNIRVIAAYYSRITLSRLTELLDLPPLTTERTLCKLVTDKTIYARIDRPAGVVNFKQKKNPTDVLNSWTNDIDKMLGLVEKTSHLVSKVSSDIFALEKPADDNRSMPCMKLSRARKSALRPKSLEVIHKTKRGRQGRGILVESKTTLSIRCTTTFIWR